jgi:hypothetical protein
VEPLLELGDTESADGAGAATVTAQEPLARKPVLLLASAA